MKKVRDLVQCIRDLDRKEKIQIGFSSIICRQDRKLEQEINEAKTKLWQYCEDKAFIFIDNTSISESCFNNSKLHLNRKGSNMLSHNIKKSMYHFQMNYYLDTYSKHRFIFRQRFGKISYYPWQPMIFFNCYSSIAKSCQQPVY